MSSGGEHPVYEVAVVGSAGFLGAAVMRAFEAAGVAVVGFTMSNPLVVEGALAPEAREVHTVVWCASRVNPRLAVESPQLVAADSADLDEALGEFSSWRRPPRVVLLSSGGTVYGPPALPPYREASDPQPVNAYGRAKLAIERHVRAAGVESVTLRVSNAYGPGQRPTPGQGVLAHWMGAVISGEQLHLYGDQTATRDYVYVDDIARAVVAAHHAAEVPPIVNIGSGVATTLKDLLGALERVVAPRPIDVVEHAARDTDTEHSVLDVALARDALDWQPQVELEHGVRQMWKWRQTQ